MPKKNMISKRKRPRKRVPKNKLAKPATRNIVPIRRFIRFPYSTRNIGTTTTISPGFHQFNLNSIYDPDKTFVGHQPLGHDQMQALYENYRVYGVLVTVTGRVLTVGATSCIGFYPTSDPAGITDVTQIKEQPETACKIFTDRDTVFLRRYFRCNDILGVSKEVYRSENRYRAPFGNDPTSLAFLNVFWQNINESDSTGHNLNVDLLMYCEVSDPIKLTFS